MEVTFQTGIGVPASCKVKYDEENKLLKGYTDRRRLRSCCKIITADFKLNIFFTVAEGNFIGFEYKCTPDQCASASLSRPLTIDGFVKLNVESFFFKGVNIVSFSKFSERYDRDAKLLLLGEEKDDISFYRICKNMSFGVDSDGKLSCILIEI